MEVVAINPSTSHSFEYNRNRMSDCVSSGSASISVNTSTLGFLLLCAIVEDDINNISTKNNKAFAFFMFLFFCIQQLICYDAFVASHTSTAIFLLSNAMQQ